MSNLETDGLLMSAGPSALDRNASCSFSNFPMIEQSRRSMTAQSTPVEGGGGRWRKSRGHGLRE